MTVQQAIKKYKLEPLSVSAAKVKAKELNVDDSTIKKSLESQSSSFGRQEIINIDDKEVYHNISYTL